MDEQTEKNLIRANAALLRSRIRMEGMIAANVLRALRGQEPAYGEDAFIHIIEDEEIGQKSINFYLNTENPNG
jgi:hypothetical protein